MLDTSRFEALSEGVKWAQAHPEVGDVCLTWAIAALEADGNLFTSFVQMVVQHEDAVAQMIRTTVKHTRAVVALLVAWACLAVLGLLSLLSWVLL